MKRFIAIPSPRPLHKKFDYFPKVCKMSRIFKWLCKIKSQRYDKDKI